MIRRPVPALALALGLALAIWPMRPWAAPPLAAAPADPAPVQAERQPLPDRATLMRLATSVMKVEALRQQGGYGLGSAVALSAEQVVTNCHVTRDARSVHVLHGGQRWPALAQAVDADHDLCLLQVPGLQAQAAALGPSAGLRPGDSVTALGYTGGLELSHSAGRVVGLHRLDGGQVIQSDNFFSSGASGGGLFDEQRRLVGILTFRLRGGRVHYFSAPTEWIASLRNGFSPMGPVGPIPRDKLAYWQQPAPLQPLFLQAGVLTSEQRWPELARLASRWSETAADDPQPWYLQGLALHRLQRWPESQRALETALHLAPTWSQAWLQLGLLHTDQGQLADAAIVRDRLLALHSDLAGELGRAMATR